MAVRHLVEVEEHHVVGRGVVQAGNEHRVCRQREALSGEPRAHLGIVEGGSSDACIHIAGVAAAGAAVEAGRVGIVGAFAAVSADEHQPRKVLHEAHVLERSGRQGRAGLGGNRLELRRDP